MANKYHNRSSKKKRYSLDERRAYWMGVGAEFASAEFDEDNALYKSSKLHSSFISGANSQYNNNVADKFIKRHLKSKR